MRSSLQKFIFTLLLIFLPSQLGIHFWPDWSYINGVRIDYFSPTLYLTDLLVLALFFLVLPKMKLKIGRISLICLIGLISFIFFNVTFSLSPAVTIYKWLKVAELGFLAWFVARNHKFLVNSYKFLLIPVLYSSLLAIWQFINQGSVGGFWYLLGERTFNRDTPGIANAIINDQTILRPYATFPHPNVLTGFLVVASLISLKYLPHISRKITALVLGLAVLVLFLTPSRGDLLQGLALRQQLNSISLAQWAKSPIIGTGLGTSPLYPRNITNYALLHQPIHNIYLLLLAETGIVGLGLFLVVVAKRLSWLLVPILFLGFFDHYWLTLQQTQLLLAIVLGII